jgi:hypothetical protein
LKIQNEKRRHKKTRPHISRSQYTVENLKAKGKEIKEKEILVF